MSSNDLPGFEILEKIGTGGMATVWKARQISLDRTVAIKILNPSFTIQLDDIQRFQREAQSAAKLKHPGIVQVYDANAVDGVYFYVMEFVSGYTVGEWIKRKGMLRESNALLVAACVAEALDYAWDSQHIIHCDIKPDNVLVDADGTVKVSDLGLSRSLNAMARAIPEEASDEVMGTPYYISPEQALGSPDLDYRADIYSLGAMLFHMLTGRMPFQDEDPEIVMEKQVTEALPPVTKLNPLLSAATAALVQRMLAKQADDRHSDWKAVIADIERAKNGRFPVGVRSSPSSAPDPHRKTMAKRNAHITRIQGKSRQHVAKLVLALAVCGSLFFFLHSASKKSNVHHTTAVAPPGVVAPTTPPPERVTSLDLPNTGSDGDAEIARLESLRERKKQRVMDALKKIAEPLARNGQFGDAANVYERYDGSFAKETANERHAMAQDFLSKVAPSPATPMPTNSDAMLDEVVTQIIALNLQEARRIMSSALFKIKDEKQLKPLQEIFEVLQVGTSIDAQILNSFVPQVGQTVTVELRAGAVSFDVRAVLSDGIQVVKAGDIQTPDSKTRILKVADFSYRERLRRLESGNAQGKALATGVMALEANSRIYAIRCFADTHEALGLRLIDRLREQND